MSTTSAFYLIVFLLGLVGAVLAGVGLAMGTESKTGRYFTGLGFVCCFVALFLLVGGPGT